jgi:hypothetical protein
LNRSDLPAVVEHSLRELGGSATLVEVAKRIWETKEADLRASGDLFYTWQYDMRWAAQKLRDARRLSYGRDRGRQIWQLI